MRLFSKTLPFLVIAFLLTSPAILINLDLLASDQTGKAFTSLIVALFAFLVPVGIFSGRVKIYLYLLTPLVILTPAFLLSIYYLGVPPGFELIAFTLQTNPREATEAIGPFVHYFILLQITLPALYIYCVHRIDLSGDQSRLLVTVSAISFAALCLIIVVVNRLYLKDSDEITKKDLIPAYEYPFTLLRGAVEARNFLRKNNLREAESFSFKAVRKDTINLRQVYVLIIGESARYDRWHLNGYNRETSPRLNGVEGLLAFHDVVSGAHYTWVAVPQIITRANPDNYNLQYREKSILAVFQEAGFKTYWLSNQSDQDIFWSGSIILHAKTAGGYSFSPTYSPNLEFENIYDGRLLPQLDSVLQADGKNLFIVLHTMGSHWEYNRRYPRDFDVFQPSVYADPNNTVSPVNKEAIRNSYDNSILYTDFIIHSVIGLVNRSADIAAVTYISDHGEDLFDTFADRPDFHFRPSAATLRVPLFIWTSQSFKDVYPEKMDNMEANVRKKIGTENVFYTLTDMANIRIEGFDSTKSFAHRAFVSSQQKFYGDDHRGHLFSTLK